MTPNNTEVNQPEPIDTKPNLVIKSSSKDKTYPQDGDNSAQKELEEEQSNKSIELSNKTLITQESGYSILRELQILKDEGICVTNKDFNVLCKTLKEEQVPSFELWLATKHVWTHQQRVAERENTPEAVDYEPVFFAHGLADAVRKEIRRQKGLEKRAARKRARENPTEYKALPIYNWLEDY